MNEIKVNLENLSFYERDTLTRLIKKANKPTPLYKESFYHNRGKYISSCFSVISAKKQKTDPLIIKNHNWFATDFEARPVAKYLKDNFLFIRKAHEFAKGFVPKWGEQSFHVGYDAKQNCYTSCGCIYFLSPSVIYMQKEDARKFQEWCNNNKELLGVNVNE